MGVDWIKYPYKTRCRFTDNPSLWSTIQWTVAPPNAQVLPYPSRICNLVLENDKESFDDTIGEEWDGYGRRANWVKTPPGITGQKVCGSESDFTDGGVYDPNPPLAAYGANGWLACCAQIPVVFGAAGASGNNSPTVRRAIKQFGYAGSGGTIRPFVLNPSPLGSGAKVGGFVLDVVSYPNAPVGGAKVGGFVLNQVANTQPPSGGAKVGGFVLNLSNYTVVPSGGEREGGTVANQVAFPFAPSGGEREGGTVANQVAFPFAPSGGEKEGGGLRYTIGPSTGVSGGVKTGGTVADVFALPGIRASNKASNIHLTGGFTTPAAAVSGDLLLLTVVIGDLVAVTGITSGWTEYVAWGSSTGFGQVQCLSYRKVAAGGAETVTWTAPSANNASVICVVVEKGAVDVFNNGGSQGASSSATITAGAVTPTGTTDVGLGWYQIMGLRTITLPGVLTALQSVQVSGGFESATLAVGWEQLSGAGSWNPGSATANAADFNDSLTVACK